MNIPDPIRVQVDVNLNFGKNSQTKQIEEEENEAFDFSKLTLDSFRSGIHEILIEELQSIYGTKDWKRDFLENAKRIHNYNIQNHLLKNFEKGENVTENFFLLVLKEIYLQKKQLSLIFTKGGSVEIE